MRSGLNGSVQKRIPVASASAFPIAAGTGLYGLSLIDFAPNGPTESVGVGEHHFGPRHVGERGNVIIAEASD